MVVGDDHTDALRSGLLDGRTGRDSAVACHDERNTRFRRRRYAGRSKVVAVAGAMGNERHNLSTGGPECSGQERRPTLAVDVVVAVHHDGVAGGDGVRDHVHGFRHTGESQRVGELVE